MIKIDTNSWHYELVQRRCRSSFSAMPQNLCPYMRAAMVQLIGEMFLAIMAAILICVCALAVLNPIISMLGFYIGNGFSSGFLPHVTYIESVMAQCFYVMFTLPFGTEIIPFLVKPLGIATANLTMSSLFGWFAYLFPIPLTLGFLFLAFALVLFIVWSCRTGTRKLSDMHNKKVSQLDDAINNDKPLGFLWLVYSRVVAYKSKVCPQIEFHYDEKD